MLKTYLKYYWFGFKALWQLVSVGIFLILALIPLGLLQKIPQLSFLQFVYIVFVMIPLIGAFYVWKSKQIWNKKDIFNIDTSPTHE